MTGCHKILAYTIKFRVRVRILVTLVPQKFSCVSHVCDQGMDFTWNPKPRIDRKFYVTI